MMEGGKLFQIRGAICSVRKITSDIYATYTYTLPFIIRLYME